MPGGADRIRRTEQREAAGRSNVPSAHRVAESFGQVASEELGKMIKKVPRRVLTGGGPKGLGNLVIPIIPSYSLRFPKAPLYLLP